MTFSIEDPRERITVRCESDLIERVETFAADHDRTKSEIVRTALYEFLPDDPDRNVPTDPKLRQVYLWLRERSDNRNLVPGPSALSKLAQKHQMDQEFIKHAYLRPLERDEWIVPKNGNIFVVEK